MTVGLTRVSRRNALPLGWTPLSNLSGGVDLSETHSPPNKFEGATRFSPLFLYQFPAKRVLTRNDN
jgi:hypothetical protein